jgi:hypothetical protein
MRSSTRSRSTGGSWVAQTSLAAGESIWPSVSVRRRQKRLVRGPAHV